MGCKRQRYSVANEPPFAKGEASISYAGARGQTRAGRCWTDTRFANAFVSVRMLVNGLDFRSQVRARAPPCGTFISGEYTAMTLGNGAELPRRSTRPVGVGFPIRNPSAFKSSGS